MKKHFFGILAILPLSLSSCSFNQTISYTKAKEILEENAISFNKIEEMYVDYTYYAGVTKVKRNYVFSSKNYNYFYLAYEENVSGKATRNEKLYKSEGKYYIKDDSSKKVFNTINKVIEYFNNFKAEIKETISTLTFSANQGMLNGYYLSNNKVKIYTKTYSGSENHIFYNENSLPSEIYIANFNESNGNYTYTYKDMTITYRYVY